MASIRRDIPIDAPPEAVWDAVRDVGAAHRRLVPGVLTDCRLEEGARVVTFANGMVVREWIVDLDEERRRFAWSARGEPFAHHNASLEVSPAGEGRSRLLWIADLLPDELAPRVAELMDLGAAAMQRTLRRP